MGPDYKKPEVNIPQQWVNIINIQQEKSSDLPYLAWWKTYDNKTLNQLILKALQANNDIQISISNLETAKGQLEQVQLGWYPTISLQAGFSQMPNLGSPGTYLGIFPNYILNLFTQYKKQEYAELNVEQAQYAISAIKLSIISEVTQSYFIYLAQEQLYQEYVQLEQDVDEILGLTKVELNIGLDNELSLKPLKVQLQNIKSQKEIFQHNIIISANALRYLLNENPGKILHEQTFDDLEVTVVNYADFPAKVLQDRPDVAYAETQLKMANTAIGIATSSFLPSINLGDFAGYSSQQLGAWQTPTKGFNLEQALVSINFDPTVFGEISTSEAKYKAQYYQYVKIIRKVLQEVDTSLSANLRYTNSYYHQLDGYKAQEKFYNLKIKLFELGLESYVPEVLAKVELSQQKILLTQSKLQQLLTVVTLYQNLGGGYLYADK
ncbi:MAG: multidrug efflux system outer membrane protein [Francisellaceae bacterium]|jgi:multidrug efflux system outer membrane protein